MFQVRGCWIEPYIVVIDAKHHGHPLMDGRHYFVRIGCVGADDQRIPAKERGLATSEGGLSSTAAHAPTHMFLLLSYGTVQCPNNLLQSATATAMPLRYDVEFNCLICTPPVVVPASILRTHNKITSTAATPQHTDHAIRNFRNVIVMLAIIFLGGRGLFPASRPLSRY
jgi:hypothetical protein